ncbi:mammalian cell entry protein [Gordonia paraffinivorans]|uniref:MlaD family protein n=1 Tax=Gordonia paraffinivorans TaxID=175628 RepID=UPI001C92BEB5|nr:MlaD family protein [Gordonia paraffinivorans]MBY4575751.1 mammalian cell entry protein [Gordonia paraffinivorans]
MSAKRTLAVLAAVCAALVVLTGCSALSPNRLPSVKAGVSQDYTVTLKFESVLNLPDGADVMMNGIQVGRVQETVTTPEGVDVIVGLTDARAVPAESSAIIRQNTPLGDTYLAIEPPANGGSGQMLADGDVIPADRTTSPPPLEDTIAVLAYFVNGGSIQKIQDTMATLNRTMPPIGDVRKIAATVSKDLEDLSRNTGELERMIHALNAVSKSFDDTRVQIDHAFSDQGVHYWKSVADKLMTHISTLLPSVGSVFTGGLFLVPMLNSLADVGEAGRGQWDQAPATGAAMAKFLERTLIPFAKNPSVNLVSVQATAGKKQLLADTKLLLSMLGAIR